MGDMPAKLIIDFSNVKESSGFNPKHQEPGDYLGTIKSVDYGKSKNDNDQITFAIADSAMPSAVYRYNCPLQENTLWKLRNIIVACGTQVPKKKVNIAAVIQKLVGKDIGMSLDDNEYEGKVSSQIVGVFPADELADDEPEPPAKKSKPSKKAAKEEEAEEDEDEATDDDVDELDIDDL